MKKRIFGMLLMGAMVVASMSMFTSCKDYDDDINKNAADITALKAELATLRTTIQGDLTSALASYATKSDLTAAVKDLEKISGLQTKLEAIEKALGETDVKKLATDLAALTGKIDKLADAEKLAAAEKNIELQAAAIEKLEKSVEELSKKGYDDTAIKADIKAIQDQIKAFTFSTDIETLKTNMQTLSNSVDAKLANINILSVLVNKMLTSVTLIPQLYLNGIEAIQFVSVQYIPQVKDYTIIPNRYNDATSYDGYWITNGTTPEWQTLGHHQLVNKLKADGVTVEDPIRIDNGETEAYYRLSPAGVSADDLDL